MMTRDVVVRYVVTVTPDSPVVVAGKLLLERRFGCLPVVDDQNVLRGIVTSSDFLRLLVKDKHEADG